MGEQVTSGRTAHTVHLDGRRVRVTSTWSILSLGGVDVVDLTGVMDEAGNALALTGQQLREVERQVWISVDDWERGRR